MKSFLFCILLFTSISYCQNFPGNDIDLLFNKELKVKEKPEGSQYSYSWFYEDAKLDSSFYGDSDYSSNYSILAGKIFRLISYERNSIWDNRYNLKLENDEIGIIYYKYHSDRQDLFDFEIIGGLDLPKDFYCKKIKQTIDKFTGEIKYESEESEGVSFIKYRLNDTSRLYMSINFSGQITTETGNGPIIILLENGKKLEYHNETIRVIQNSVYLEILNMYRPANIWLGLISLSEKDVKLLTESKITDIRLSISDKSYGYGDTLIEYLKCLFKK